MQHFFKINFFRSNFFIVIAVLVVFYGCMVTSHSDKYQKLLDDKLSGEELGKAKFLYGDMGGIYPHTLKTNAFVYKMAILALTILDSTQNKYTEQIMFTKYGFLFPKKIWNWETTPILNLDKPIGLIFGKISGIHPLRGRFFIETADFGCGSCHGGILYDKIGNATDYYVLGIPNTSLNLDKFANDLFEGYKIMLKWDETKLEKKIRALYPKIAKEELTGIKIIFNGMKKEVKKTIATRGKAASYKIGGPGMMNGIGAVKRGLGMLDNSIYHEDEVALVSIPALTGRSFRSSFLVSGNYAPKKSEFFHTITEKDISIKHDQEMATIISLFTIGTMGYDEKMAANTVTDVKDIMKFVSKIQTPPFPGKIDTNNAEEGKFVFEKNCQSCHGKYEGTATKNKLVSFPNQYIPFSIIQTDSVRAIAITGENIKMLDKIEIGKYFDARVNKGYIAPILMGVWTSAPYLHNGSVPTLWHLMHPKSRPDKFYLGGHQLDYEKMGIKGEIKNGIYKYPEGYRSWADYEIYDTKKRGLSNTGHIEPFDKMTEQEKECLLEFLKTL